ncbi:MAG: glycosyltransferase family 2 protein [Saprospiraceae bacterium]|nr:glycosyltransferase family 2 protein [Lewinella sp.]
MKVSILINNYNNGPYIRECLESAFGQETTHEIEVIVYDDGSTDQSLEEIAKFPEAKLIHHPNYGKTSMLNQAHGIQEAFYLSTGQLIFLLDGDDAFLPHKVDRVISEYQERPFDLLAHSYTPGEPHIPEATLEDVRERFMVGYIAATSCLVAEREFMASMFPINEAFRLIWFDNRIHVQSIIRGRRRILQEPLTFYRQHPESFVAKQSFLKRKRLVWEVSRYFNHYSPRKMKWGKILAFKIGEYLGFQKS